MWNRIEESAFEDETLGNSFLTNGLFRISNEEQSTKDPRIISALQNKKVLIAVDKSLISLKDESIVDCQQFSFTTEIDCFAVSKSGDLTVCCLSDGGIYGIHIKGLSVFNLMIQEEDIQDSRTFLDILQVNDEYHIMCTNGKVYKLHKIDERQLSELVENHNEDNNELNETILKTTTLEKIVNIRLSKRIDAFCLANTYDGDLYIVSGLEGIYFITPDNVDHIRYPSRIKHIKKIYNLEHYIVGLTDAGKFVQICPYTKTLCLIKGDHEFNGPIEDMRVLESNDEYIELLLLSAVDGDERLMSVIDFPSMNCKSELKVPAVSYLVTQQKSSVNMFFISGTTNTNNFVQSIEFKSITETDPEQRYKKLLLREHFEEAEEFAKQFDLSLEPLHQARVRRSLLNILGARPSSSAFEKLFKILMKQLAAIEDKSFLVTLRRMEIPDRTSMTTFLEYLQQNIDTNQYENETNEINELLLRLETLRLIDPEECNMQWPKFLYNSDMARIAMDYFKSDVLLSCLIWSRHASSIMPNLNLEQFHKWLSNIPSTVEPFSLIQWLKHFSPCFLQLYPNEMTHLVDWCLDRTRGLQFANAWPEIGLEFINNINGIFKDVQFMFVDIRRSYHNNMEKIQKLIFTLEEMAVLKKSYHLTMTLDDYSKGSTEETAFRLLQRIQMQNLKRLVNDFLYPIFMERGLSPEETIVKYIQFLCTNKNLGYWQERAVTAIDLLHIEENSLSSALLVLKVSPVPWSEVVLPLASLGTSSTHPLANSIYVEFKTQSIKMIKVKYGWPVDYFDLQQDRVKLVNRVLKVHNPDMIEDVKILVKSSPDIAHEAYFYLVLRLVRLGMIDELADVIQFIEDDLDTCRDFFDTMFNSLIMEIDEDDLIEGDDPDNYMEGIKLLADRLKVLVEDYKSDGRQENVMQLKYIMRLRKVFKFKVTLKLMSRKVGKDRLMEEGIAQLAMEAQEASSIDGIWSKVDLLVASFGFGRIYGYYLFCMKMNNLYVTCRIVDVLNSSIDAVEKKEVESALNLSILMIAQQITYFENNLSATFQNYDPLTFPLAYEFLVKCLVNYDVFNHLHVLEMIRWVRVGRNFYPYDVVESTKSDRVMNSKMFGSKMTNGVDKANGDRRESYSIFDVVEEKVGVKQVNINENLNPVLRCVCHGLKVATLVLNSSKDPYKKFKSHLGAIGDGAQQIKNDFFGSLESILKMKLHQPVVHVMYMIIEQQKIAQTIILPQLFVTNVNKKILKFLLSQKEPDYMDAFRIFRSEVNRDECLDYLRSVLKNNSQKIAYSTFSEMYNKYMGNSSCVADERQNRLKFYYYSELCKYDTSLRFKSNFDNIDIGDLLKDLENRLLSVELVKKLSKDFDWDLQKVLIQQIKILLRSQELEFEIKTDVFGKDEVIIKSSVEAIRKRYLPYLNEITDNKLLATEMKSFIKEINYYFYEMYLVVFDLIEHAKELSIEQKIFRNILLLLKHKLTGKRRSAVQGEVECWQKIQSDNSLLPLISKYRLPFKPMMEKTPEEFLDEDLNVETFEKCIPLITMHASASQASVEERLEVCAFKAVKNSMIILKPKLEMKYGQEWSLKPTNNAFLQTILRMVSLLKDKPKRLAILYFYVQHSPEGSDQVEAAYECWKFAVEHEGDLKDSKYNNIIEKITYKYPMLKTQHMLHLYGLAEDKLTQLVDNPTELIHALYHHDSILQPQKKDINKLCDELAQLHKLDLLSLQHKLLHKWLAFAGTSSLCEDGDANETLYEDFIGNPTEDEVTFVSDENVIRAHYILSSWNNNDAMNFLASELVSSSSNAENQLQLYETFAKLINDQSESYMDLINPSNYLLIKCCHYLKQLGFNLKLETFKQMDKVVILKKIWTSHYNNSKGLEVMSFICLGFNVHTTQIWNGILKQMVALKMFQHLSILVEILSTKSKFLHLNSLKSAWQCVIKEPFLHATKARSYEQDLKLSKAIILLQKCPISTFLDLEGLIEQCMRIERPYMAAIFVAFVNENNRAKFVKMLEPYDKRQLKKDIVELEEMGISPVITKSVSNILKL